MIKARFETTQDQKSFVLTIRGHAGQAEAGKDLICASATILAYTAAQIVSELYADGKLKKKPAVTLNEGNAVITCKPRKDAYAKALQTFLTVQAGFALLAHHYPEYVQITRFDRESVPVDIEKNRSL